MTLKCVKKIKGAAHIDFNGTCERGLNPTLPKLTQDHACTNEMKVKFTYHCGVDTYDITNVNTVKSTHSVLHMLVVNMYMMLQNDVYIGIALWNCWKHS